MFGFSIDDNSLSVQRKGLEDLMTDSPELRQKIQEVIAVEMKKARGRLSQDIHDEFPNGKQESYRAVRRTVYQKILGGSLNILNMQRGTASWKVTQKDRAVTSNPKMRGGNRRKRGFLTIRMQGYEGKALGFLLRWLNSGTRSRYIGGRNGEGYRRARFIEQRNERGFRGALPAYRYFERLANKELEIAAQAIGMAIDEEMQKYITQNQ